MDNLESKIVELKQVVSKSKTGHLHMKKRVELLDTIKISNLINKIFFECLKKVYPVWNEEYPNNKAMIEILSKADDFLYNETGNKKVFESFFNEYSNYFEAIEGSAGLAGMTAKSLCASIAYDIDITEDYTGEDDNDFDWQDWNPDFYSSMAFSGGNPFVGEGDIEKRKEFWNWYLDAVLKMAENPNKPLITLNLTDISTKNTKQSTRLQTINTDIIHEKIQTIIDITVQDLLNQKGNIHWDKIEINSCHLPSGISILTHFYVNDNKKEVERVWDRTEEAPVQLLNVIKKEMYKQFPHEGAWIECKMIINPDETYTIAFNYDDFDKLTKRAKNPENLTREFEKFPRSKEFTPDWWQNILGKKVKYLK